MSDELRCYKDSAPDGAANGGRFRKARSPSPRRCVMDHRLGQSLLVTALVLLAFARAAFADSVVVFNEIHYHPATNETALEWLELHNQMSIDVDLSGW